MWSKFFLKRVYLAAMNQPFQIRIILVLVAFLCFPLLSQAADAHEEYLAQSASLRKLADLNDMLHVLIYNRQEKASVPIPDVGHGIFASSGATISFDESNGYYGISGKDFVRLFEERFELSTHFQEPLVFSSLVISDLIQSIDSKEIKLGGWMSLAGSVNGENMNVPHPFIVTFEVDFETEGPECAIKAIEWGASVQLSGIQDSFQGSKLHSVEFLDPERSPLVKRGLCSHHDLDAIALPMRLLIEQRSWERGAIESKKWDDEAVSRYMLEASVGMADLWLSLPYYTPLGKTKIPNYYRFQGDKEVDDLIVELNNRSPQLRQLVQSFSTKYRNDSDLRRIEALSIRAWHNLVNEDMSKEDLYFKDISNATFCPLIKEFDLFKMFGYARIEDFGLSQEHFQRFQGNGSRSVMLFELNKIYNKLWYDHGKELDTFNAHNESMLALYLGGIFGNDEGNLMTISAKAEKMDEPELAINCLNRVLEIDENEGDSDLWYRLALVKAGNMQDPAKDLAIAESLSSEPSVMSQCAVAKYLILTGRQTEGYEIINQASKQFKKTEDLMRVKAETSTDHKDRKKAYKKLILKSSDSKGEKYFKLGFVEQQMADATNLDLSEDQKRGYYKDALYHYRRALSRGFDPALGYKKIAETYVSLNELKDASHYFNKAIKNQERSGSVYFAVSLLNFISNDQENFEKNMDIVRELRIDEIGTERDQALFRFMDTFSEIETLMELSNPKKKLKDADRMRKREDLIDEKTTSIEGKVRNMYALFTPQDSAYAGLCQATLQSIKGYNNMDLRPKKEYQDVNINDEEVIERMLNDSDMELYFFHDNEVIQQAAEWNDIFNDSILKNIPKEKNRSGMKYLKESKTFKDSYNYL
jgi:tetratricopeptide (TPR) repeat protein